MSNRKHSFIDRVRSFIWRNWQGQVLIGPQDPVPPSSLALVTREYVRACSERGRGPHIEGEDLARAAAVYASPDRLVVEHTGMSPWPWPERCDEINQLTRVEQLTRAAVLCMREIDRLREGGAVAQDHFAGGGKMVDNKGPTAAPCEREAGAVDNKDFRPGLPPLELRRVHQYWESSFSDCVYSFEEGGERFRIIYQSGGDSGLKRVAWNEFKMDMRPHGKTWAEVESLAAAKVAADKQPWERGLERLWSKFFLSRTWRPVSDWRGFEDGDPVGFNEVGEYRLLWVHTQDEQRLFRALWPIEKLRRVVDSGQGSAEVPRAIIDRYPLADGKPRGEGCWMCCKSERLPEFEVFCDRGNFRDVFWTFGTTLNAFIHAAGNEMVKGGAE